MKKQKNNQTLGAMGERGFLRRFLPQMAAVSRSSYLVPPGDDAAVLRAGPRPVLSIDGLTEGTHFRSSWEKSVFRMTGQSFGFLLGQKLLGCSLSDLAAMGEVKNRWSMVYLGTPSNTSAIFLSELYKGVRAAAKKAQCLVVGGDTVRAKELTLVAAVGGYLVHKKPLTRQGALVGDFICVAGDVGDASVGLKILEKKVRLAPEANNYFVRKFFQHQPRWREARRLSRENGVTTLMDLSDSLGESIQLLCQASSVGAIVEVGESPCSTTYNKWFKKSAELLSGGEDYALLFTVRPSRWPVLKHRVRAKIIGTIKPAASGIHFFMGEKLVKQHRFFEHF